VRGAAEPIENLRESSPRRFVQRWLVPRPRAPPCVSRNACFADQALIAAAGAAPPSFVETERDVMVMSGGGVLLL